MNEEDKKNLNENIHKILDVMDNEIKLQEFIDIIVKTYKGEEETFCEVCEEIGKKDPKKALKLSLLVTKEINQQKNYKTFDQIIVEEKASRPIRVEVVMPKQEPSPWLSLLGFMGICLAIPFLGHLNGMLDSKTNFYNRH